MEEVLFTPPASPEVEPVPTELPGSGVPRTPPFRAPAASSSSAGPSGSVSPPGQWSPVLRTSSAGANTGQGGSTSREVFLAAMVPEEEIIAPDLWQDISGEVNPDFPDRPWYYDRPNKGKGKGKAKGKGKGTGGRGRSRTSGRTSWDQAPADTWTQPPTSSRRSEPSWRYDEWYG